MSIRKGAWVVASVGLMLSAPACFFRGDQRPELLVFAAISLTDALTEIGRAFEEQSETRVSFSFGGSQTLAQQIASGAPADFFVAAGEFPMEFLEKRGLIESEAVNLLSNQLVIVKQPGGINLESVEQLVTNAVDRLAVADPELAPAGRYARESLISLGLWDELQSKLVIGADVRVTLVYVETGNVDVALVYRTDAMKSSGVVALDLVPPDSHSQIVYPGAVISRSEDKALSREFLRFLRSRAAGEIFRRHGFEPLEP